MSEELFRGVQVEDRGLDDSTAQILLELQSQLRRSFSRAREEWTSSQSVTVNVNGVQGDLEDMLNRGMLRKGMIVWMYISWAEAQQLIQWGFAAADGSNGTPPLIPPQGTSDPQRGLIAVKYGSDPFDAGGNANTGGASTHGHSSHCVDFSKTGAHDLVDFSKAASHEAIAFSNVGPHTVDFSGTCPHPTTGGCNGSDYCALVDCGNNHCGTQELTHSGTQTLAAHSGTQDIGAHSGTQSLSHDAASSMAPYAEAIPMMKVR